MTNSKVQSASCRRRGACGRGWRSPTSAAGGGGGGGQVLHAIAATTHSYRALPRGWSSFTKVRYPLGGDTLIVLFNLSLSGDASVEK